MSQTSQVSEAIADSPFISIPASPGRAGQSSAPFPQTDASHDLLLPIVTASLALHFLAIAWIGFGVPKPELRSRRVFAEPQPTPVIENVKIEEIPSPPEAVVKQEQTSVPDAPSPEAAPALPSLPPLQPIAAVAATVPVAFGVEVKGPVRLVSDASAASGAFGQRRPTEPLSLDTSDVAKHDLLLPELSYPIAAKKRHWVGTVLVEFKTSPTGDIQDVRLHQSSGHDALDEAALENVRRGRWKGQPGYYLKAFEFSLQ